MHAMVIKKTKSIIAIATEVSPLIVNPKLFLCLGRTMVAIFFFTVRSSRLAPGRGGGKLMVWS